MRTSRTPGASADPARNPRRFPRRRPTPSVGRRAFRAGVAGGFLVCAVFAQRHTGAADPLTFSTTTLPEATKLEPYLDDLSQPIRLQASGGFPGYNFRLLAGSPPSGISLLSDGTLAGTPDRCGSFVFQAQVVDSIGSFANRTFLVTVGGVPRIVIPPQIDLSVDAGSRTTLSLPLTNLGCDDVSFRIETEDVGPMAFSSPSRRAGGAALAGLMRIGGPVPRTLGSREAVRRPHGEGWSVEAGGRLIDGEGNPSGLTSEALPEGLVQPLATLPSVLYVDESATQGERERIEALGFTVVQALVPQALDLETLRAFDVLWLTAATDAAFPSRDAILQYVFEGGGLVIGQVEFSGTVPLLPPGYRLDTNVGRPTGNINRLAFTAASLTDPLTQGLTESDLPSNFDTTRIATSGGRWTFLATQADTPALGTLATASYGAGRIIYHSGNLGTSIIPGASNGSDEFVLRLVVNAVSGNIRPLCPWLHPGAGHSDVRIEELDATRVESFDDTGETVSVDLEVDTSLLGPGQFSCNLFVEADQADALETQVPVVLTVGQPVPPTILPRTLPHAEPGAPYGATLTAAGGSPPYTFAMTGGGLPVGLLLDPGTGVIAGTPSEAGIFKPTFQITDSLSQTSERSFVITSGFVIETETLPDAVLGGVYAVPIFAVGGTPPYHFELGPTVNFTLPATAGTPAAAACTTTDLGGGTLSTSCTLDSGAYRVLFDPVSGFTLPSSADVDVPPGGSVSLIGDYLANGTITVTTNLTSAFYSLTGDTPVGIVQRTGRGVSTTFSDLTPGTWTVQFTPVSGFATPDEQTGVLAEGGTLSFDGSYVQVTPAAATSAGRGALSAGASMSGGGPGTETSPASPALPPKTGDSEIGFGTGILTVVSDAPGATFRLVGNRLPTLLALAEPEDQGGRAAALVGRMTSFTLPLITDGQKVSFDVIGEDSAQPPNRFRATYAPVVRAAPVLGNLSPSTAGEGMSASFTLAGTALRDDATVSLGPGIVVEELLPLLATSGTAGLFVETRITPGLPIDRRDLVYVDPRLADTSIGSVTRRPSVLRLFPELARTDVDGSSLVNGFDLAFLARAFGLSQGDPGFEPAADFTNDGRVDGDDLGSLAITFGRRTLAFDPSALPPAAASLGIAYEHRVPFVGGNSFLSIRQLAGALPDGLALSIEVGTTPGVTELVIAGIPAEAGTFTVTVQAVDGFFALAVTDLVVTVNP